jgi:hypothetical protein
MSQATTTPTSEQRPDEGRLLTPLDVARLARCHPNTARAIGDQLRLPILRTASGTRLYNTQQAAKIAAELERRRREGWR